MEEQKETAEMTRAKQCSGKAWIRFTCISTWECDSKGLFEIGDALAFDEDVRIGEMNFQRTKAWMRTYPVSLKNGPFTFYLNRVSMFIQVGSLGFEMRGFQGCLAWLFSVMDQLNGARLPWIEHLMVSRIDVFTDFIFDDDFNPEQFQTRLRRKGTFISGENEEGRTYYFGSRSIFCVRLYVKSVEINKAGKQYLRAEWKNNGYTDQRVWRLEFEFRKQKLERLMGRELVKFDEKALTSLSTWNIATKWLAGCCSATMPPRLINTAISPNPIDRNLTSRNTTTKRRAVNRSLMESMFPIHNRSWTKKQRSEHGEFNSAKRLFEHKSFSQYPGSSTFPWHS